MSDILNEAIEGLTERLAGKNLGGSVRFDIKNEGSIHVDGDNIRIAEDDADCTLGASGKNFRKLLDGKLNPTLAVMSGKLSIGGDMTIAVKLAANL
jgi:putative sterol carrier protein